MSKLEKPQFKASLLHPKFWPLALAMMLFWLVVRILPFSTLMWLGKVIGLLFLKFAKRRTSIARVNIQMCFPELTSEEQSELLRKNMICMGRAVFDTAITWFWPYWRLNNIIEVKGLDYLRQAHNDGDGVLFISAHFTSIEVACSSLAINYENPVEAVYQPHANKLYDYLQRKGRERHRTDFNVIPKKNVRGMIKCLREGKALHYLPDQDYGRKHSVFVPFFGVQAATVVAPSQLAKAGKAKVLSYSMHRNEACTGYILEVHPAIEGFGEKGEVEDVRLINERIEKMIRLYPEQYLWVHRRFKTRPEGEANVY